MEARKGFWPMQAYFYLSWTGRYTSTFLQTVLSQLDLASIYPWFCMATLLGTLFAFRAVIGTVYRSDTPRLPLTVAAATATVVFVGSLPSSTEAFYWMTSAITYQWGIITYLVWLALLIRVAREEDHPTPTMAPRALVAALTVLLPGFNEVLAPIVLITLAGFLAVNRWQRHKTDRFMLTLLGVAVVLSAASVLAPGNAARSSTYPQIPTRHDLGFALAETARQTVRFLANFGSYPALWVAGCAVWWWGPRSLTEMAPKGGVRIGAASVLITVAVVYITLFPLYWEYGEVNYTGEGRTYNITYFALCAVVLMAVANLLGSASAGLRALSDRVWPTRATVDLVLAGTLAALMVFSSGTLRAFRALPHAPDYLQAQQARESILRAPQNRGKAVFVDAMQIRPDALFWGEIQPDDTHWINSCVATYYGLGSVRTPDLAQSN